MTHRPQPKQPPIPSQRWHPAPEAETEDEAAERQAEFERQRAEYEEERQRREEERKQQFEREQAEIEAERNRRAEILKCRRATFERILENSPPMFTALQLRVFLRALVKLDLYTLTDDVAEHFAADDENNQQTAEEILLSAYRRLHGRRVDRLRRPFGADGTRCRSQRKRLRFSNRSRVRVHFASTGKKEEVKERPRRCKSADQEGSYEEESRSIEGH